MNTKNSNLGSRLKIADNATWRCASKMWFVASRALKIRFDQNKKIKYYGGENSATILASNSQINARLFGVVPKKMDMKIIQAQIRMK